MSVVAKPAQRARLEPDPEAVEAILWALEHRLVLRIEAWDVEEFALYAPGGSWLLARGRSFAEAARALGAELRIPTQSSRA